MASDEESQQGESVQLRATDVASPGLHPGVLPATLGGAAAAAVGVVSAFAPERWLLAVIAALVLLAPLVVARLYVNAGPATLSLPMTTHGAGVVEADALAPARYLYYAGMVTIGQLSLRSVAGLAVSDWLFFAGLCAAAGGLILSKGTLTFRIPLLIVLGVVLFVISGALSSLDAVAPLSSMARVGRFGYLTIVWFWLGTVVLTRPKHLRVAIGMWTISIALDGLAAIAQARGVVLPFVGPVTGGRMTGFTEHVNDLGGAAAIAMAPAFALVFTASRVSRQLLWVLVLLGIVAAAVLSGSIGGMAAGLGAVGVWFVLVSRGPRPIMVSLAVLTLAVGLVQVQSDLGLPTPETRLLSATGFSEGGRYSTIVTRARGYESAWAAFGNGGWLGAGLDLRGADVGGGSEVHNVLLLAWYEAGWAAAVGIGCVLIGGLGYALRAIRRARDHDLRLLAAGLFSSLSAFVALGFSIPMLHQRYGWVALALTLVCWSLTSRPEPGVDDLGGRVRS